MTTLLLIRHAPDDIAANTLAGRLPGIHLSPDGRLEAEKLAARLEAAPIAAIYSSPQPRAVETAEALARRLRLQTEITDGFNELDYGRWTGRCYDELRGDPVWTAFNTVRSLARIPGGESILEVETRAMAEIQRLRRLHPSRLVAIVTHADVIRVVLAHCMGLAIDLALRIEIEPASVSIIRLDDSGPRILLVDGGDLDKILG